MTIRALGDIRVVELTTELWSAFGAALLGDFGADVIRVEDLSRPARDPDRDGTRPPGGFDADSELVQRNKRSIGLDLRDPAARQVLADLLATADVFLTDLPFAEIEAQGWSYDDLAAANPGIVYVRGSGFGPRGPDRDLPALDELAAARTGVMPTLPQPGEPPVYAGAGQMYTAVMLAFGTLVALHERAESGEGQVVDASLFAGNMYGSSLMLDAYMAMRDDRLSVPVSRLDAGNPMSGAGLAYPTSDGRWVTLTMPDTDRWWPSFSEMMGLDVDDPRWDTHDKRCGEGRREMMAILEERFSQQSGAYWRERFSEARLSADIMERYEYAADYTQAAVNRYILELEHPSYGRYQSLGFPVHMGDTPARLRRMAPGVGQHGAEVLQEVLGRSDAEIAELESAGVLGTVRAEDASRPSTQSGESREPERAVSTGAGPLAGVRVLDLTVWFQGPVCGQLLADFGADVIHIERPEFGDPARGVRSINAIPVAEWNQYFLVVNRNKRSMAIDLKSDAGRELLHRMVEQADVFLWNQSMDNLATLGLDYETLSAINPKLVFATNSGYGHRGSNRPAFDMTVQALTGIMTRLGEPGQPPIYLGLGGGDAFGGLMSALGIMVALHHRRETGRGQYVDASLLGSQLYLAVPSLQRFLASHNPYYADQHSRHAARNPLWNRYRAEDGWMFICMEDTEESFASFCAATGAAVLCDDPRFSSHQARRIEHESLVKELDSVMAERTTGEWMQRFAEHGVVAAPILDFRDMAVDEQAWANDYLLRAPCGEAGGDVEFRGLPVTLSRTPGRVEQLGLELGQDTELALFDTFGVSWDEIAELKVKGAIP
jgi:crotonobetainyl-CoA:carnitine CoA-transferase CaiB-like acyl-CoA transferase